MESTINEPMVKKRNVILVVFLTIITLGVYAGYWFLKNKNYFLSISSVNPIPFKWWVVFTIYLVISFLLTFTDIFFFTAYSILLVDSIEIILTYFYVGLLYYSVFRIKELLEDHYDEIQVNTILLFLFNFWYVQHKLNQLYDATQKSDVA